MTWDQVANATGYRVYQTMDAGKTWSKVADVAAPPLLVQVPASELLIFCVTAYNTVGTSPCSNYAVSEHRTYSLPSQPFTPP
jgi:hypothetical protein